MFSFKPFEEIQIERLIMNCISRGRRSLQASAFDIQRNSLSKMSSAFAFSIHSHGKARATHGDNNDLGQLLPQPGRDP